MISLSPLTCSSWFKKLVSALFGGCVGCCIHLRHNTQNVLVTPAQKIKVGERDSTFSGKNER